MDNFKYPESFIEIMKFAHIADAHLGAFSKNPKLKELNLKAFEIAIQKSIEEQVDFIIIAGDLFHNPIPDMEIVRRAVEILKNAGDRGIRIYAIYGSHDFSAGSTALLDVLSSTGLFKKVVNYEVYDGKLRILPVEDPTGVNILGVSGLSSAQEVEYFEHIDRDYLERIEHPKIFVFHTTISELKPSYIPDRYALPKSLLPQNFDYYAGGHLHERIESDLNGSPLIYPGALFGATYNDLDILKERGFYIVEDFKPRFVPVEVCKFYKRVIKADGYSVEELNKRLLELSKEDYNGQVVILKVKGELSAGKVGEIDFHSIRENIRKTAIDVLLNTYSLRTKEREKLNVVAESKEEIEEGVFKKISKYGIDITRRTFNILKEKQPEGMRKDDFSRELMSKLVELIDNIKVESKEEKNDREEVKENRKSGKTLFDFGVRQ
ncbi:Ser/Thr protein phosphatase family protein [Aciduliprofundum boonei T469]|nr:Ser/Thr protein phosphatase family protein [Aciduliprofundum boonei T469]